MECWWANITLLVMDVNMIIAMVLASVVFQTADDVSTKFIGSGAMKKLGGYAPMRAEMDGTADLVKKVAGRPRGTEVREDQDR